MNRIAERRIKLNMTQPELSNIVRKSDPHLDVGMISRFENGVCLPTPEQEKAIAEALGVTRNYLFGVDASGDITKETRRASYDEIKEKREKRQLLILEILGSREMTASEIAKEMLARGHTARYDRNSVAPRLTELRDAGILKTVGKRICPETGRPEAIWTRKEKTACSAATEQAANAKGL